MERRHIDLFSGIGGFALAAHWAGYQTEVFCEQDAFCQKVLSRHWPTVPIVSDIHDFDGSAHTGADLLTGGFPCQPFSCAGKQQGDADDRFLWPEMLRVISEARPAWIVGENVAGIISMALDGVLSDLEAEGYATQAFVLPACAVNAPHKRDRVWIVAHSKGYRMDGPERENRESQGVNHQKNRMDAIGKSEVMAHTKKLHSNGCNDYSAISMESRAVSEFGDCGRQAVMAHSPQFSERKPANQTDAFTDCREARDELGNRHSSDTDPNSQPTRRPAKPWRECGSGQPQSRMGVVAHGLPGRLDGHFDSEPAHIPRIATGIPQRAAKLKALGNAIVPQVAYEILQCIHPIIETAKWK